MTDLKRNGGDRLVLVTGATGYVGGCLLERLRQAGYRLRCLARRPQDLEPTIAICAGVVCGDVLDPVCLRGALEGVDTAYYLVHSMASAGDFEEVDRCAARTFAVAAREAGVRRIIYLGGLGSGDRLSKHLASRQEVGRILRESGVPTIEFRASVIIGPGSASFEMVRALVEKLPVMIMPRWVRTRAQPIATEDVIDYLVAALDIDIDGNPVFEIGGADKVSYMQIMREYARQRGLKRLFIPVPMLSPGPFALSLGMMTPLYARIGRALIESVRNETVVMDDSASRLFGIRPRGISEAIREALEDERGRFAATHWEQVLRPTDTKLHWGGARFGSRLIHSVSVAVPRPPSESFRPILQIGGETGWYYANWLWWLRGFIDRALGGPGMRREARDGNDLKVGDHVDSWRVEAFERDHLMRLSSEMKMPGQGWLQYEVVGDGGQSTVRQTAIFDSVGLPGLVYWYSLYPVHRLVWAGMLHGIVNAIEDGDDST